MDIKYKETYNKIIKIEFKLYLYIIIIQLNKAINAINISV